MNDYILYNELGRGAHTTVYKGRKKGQIDFVAICSYEKEYQSYVHNKVSILSQTKHPNVIEFYEWYETSSHFWVIEELCNGCSLAMALSQDSPAPEYVIRNCALQLTKALYNVHSAGVIVRNLHPHKIYIDSKGSLKLGGLLMGVDLTKPSEDSVTPALSPLYCCPESLINNTWSYASDLWSLGAILFHMLTGVEPFPGTTLEEITEGIKAEEDRRKDGSRRIPVCSTSTKTISMPECGVDGVPISDELHDLLSGLLDPNPETRLNWKDLEKHPFFATTDNSVQSFLRKSQQTVAVDGILKQTVAVDETLKDDDSEDKSEDITDSLNKTFTAAADISELAPSELPTDNTFFAPHVAKSIHLTKESSPDLERSSTKTSVRRSKQNSQKSPRDSKESSHKSPRRSKESRPLPALEQADVRQSVVLGGDDDDDCISEHITESMVQIPQIELPPQKHPSQPISGNRTPATPPSQITLDPSTTLETLMLEYQATLIPQPIIGNPKIFKDPVSMRCDVRSLPWQPLAEQILAECDGSEISHHLVEVADYLSKKTVSARDLGNCVGYIFNLTSYENCVYLIVNSELLLSLAYLVKTAADDAQLKIVQVIGALIQNSTTIEPETQLGECVTVLTDILRDSSRSPAVRLFTLATLGELIFFIASQEETDGENSSWNIPGSTFVCVTRCLREGEETQTQLCAAKILENVCSVRSQYSKHFAQDAVSLSLWKLQMKQPPTDSAYITYVRALTNMTVQQSTLLTHVITKIGLVNVLDNLNKSQPYMQKEIMNFLLHGLGATKPNATSKRVIADKPLLQLAITLMGNPHSICKSFSALLVSRLLVGNDALIAACNMKLIQVLDRELKKTSDNFANKCLSYLSQTLLSFLPNLLDQVESTLKKVENRRNPSTAQAKELSTALSSLPTVLHMLASRALSQHALSGIHMEQLCDILRMVPGLQCGDTGLGNPTLLEETLSTLFSISEICLPHMGPEQAIPVLGILCRCQGDYRGVAVQLCVRTTERAVHTLDPALLSTLFSLHVLPVIQEILLETPPLPTLALRILLPLLSVLPELQLEEHGIVTALVELTKDVDPEEGLCHLILETLAAVMSADNVDFSWLYTLGVHEQLSLLLLKLGVSTNVKEDTSLAGLRCLSSLLNYVMSVVKKALQTKNKTTGEEVLRKTQCVVNTCGVLLVWYHLTPATTALLSITQLYGGQYKDFLTPYNVDILVDALKNVNEGRVKTTLKILKRIMSTDPVLVDAMISSTKEQLNKTVVAVKASNPTLVQLADEVSKLILK